MLYDLVDIRANLLAPHNSLVFATEPLTDLAPCAGRMTIAARSPTTGIQGYSNVGYLFGIELKRAGYDIIVVVGKSEKLVYIWVNDGKVEIRDAGHIWGKRGSRKQI